MRNEKGGMKEEVLTEPKRRGGRRFLPQTTPTVRTLTKGSPQTPRTTKQKKPPLLHLDIYYLTFIKFQS